MDCDCVFSRRLRRKRKNPSKARPLITATPPKAPPTIAPIGADEAGVVGAGGPVVEEDVEEDVGDVVGGDVRRTGEE